MPPKPAKKLPEANEFSPGQLELGEVLKLADKHGGDRDALVEALRVKYKADKALKHKDPTERLKNQRTLAYNILVGMSGYGLFDLGANELTPVGQQLLAIKKDDVRAEAFASHILKSCYGLEVLDALRTIQARGESAVKAPLQAELESRGFKLPRATTHHTKVLQWLREAGVLDTKNRIDEEAVARLAGIGLKMLEEWSALTRQQQAFLRTLRRLADVHGTDMISAKDIITQSQYEHGSIFRMDQLARQVFRPLEEQGWIVREVKPGRGSHSGTIAATPKLVGVDLELLPSEDGWGIPAELRPKLNTPISEISKNLKSSSKHKKGIALELLAVRIAMDAGLTPLRFRLRARETGGAEVDLIAEGAHLHFSRWLFQCKNTKSVNLSALAKEVGMAVMLRAHVIVLVTTGKFLSSVERFAKELMETQHLQVILIDQEVLAEYRSGGMAALMGYLHSTAEAAMQTKRVQIERPLIAGDL